MHPSPPKPKLVLSPEQVIMHREWLDTPGVRPRIEALQAEIEDDITNLLASFRGQSELDVKLTLQTIKIKRQHLLCLTQPIQPANPA